MATTQQNVNARFVRELKDLTTRYDNQMVPSVRKGRIIKHLALACMAMMEAD